VQFRENILLCTDFLTIGNQIDTEAQPYVNERTIGITGRTAGAIWRSKAIRVYANILTYFDNESVIHNLA